MFCQLTLQVDLLDGTYNNQTSNQKNVLQQTHIHTTHTHSSTMLFLSSSSNAARAAHANFVDRIRNSVGLQLAAGLFLSKLLAMGIAALIVGLADGQETCLQAYPAAGLSAINYGHYLVGYGASHIAVGGAMLLLLLCLAGGVRVEGCINTLSILLVLFKVAWYGIGTALYFGSVYHHCSLGTRLGDFAMALFVVDTVAVGTPIVGMCFRTLGRVFSCIGKCLN